MQKLYTIHDLFKILPFNTATRTRLMAEYEGYDEAEKLEVKQICWDAFHKMTAQLSEIMYGRLMDEVSAGTKQLTPQLAQEARAMVYKEYDDVISGKKEELHELDEIRMQLKQLSGPVN